MDMVVDRELSQPLSQLLVSSSGVSRRHMHETSFQQDVKAIDPKALTTAMGGTDKPPEEPLLSTFEEGFGYFTSAAVGRLLKHYEFVRKVRWASQSPRLSPVLIIGFSWVGLLLPLCGSRCEFLLNSN
jgi:hypothetical protein